MIFISDSANSQSLGWLQDLDRDARRSGGDSQFKKTLAAEALPTTQISLEVGNSSEQQSTRNALMAQQSDTVRGAANTLARLQQFLAAQEPATTATPTDPAKDGTLGSVNAEFEYQNEEGDWVKVPVELKTGGIEPFEGFVTPEDQTKALLSVLNSLIYGVPLSDEAKELIKGEDSFMWLLGIEQDELNYAKENPDYVLDTPLGKMTYSDLEELSKRVYNYVDNPTFITRLAALATLQDIDERQDELTAQFGQQTPFSKMTAQMQEAAQQRTEVAQEQELQDQIKELHDKEHAADQDFITNLKFSYDLLRS